jgi:serine-type D-Ala-D-Ala carboxypeptidase (penicillin-binding protein 5/6)
VNLRSFRSAVVGALLGVALGTQLVLTGLSSADPAGPPPTPVPPRGSPSPFPQVLHTPSDATAVPVLDVPVAILADLDSGRLFFAESPQARRSIASLTKLMTALLVLERRSLDDVVEVSPDAVFDDDDFGASSTLGLRAGERRTVRELLYALLLQSANDAAVALAIDVSGSEQAFVRAMNRRADTLGMHETEFFSPNGLDDRGRSSARDLLLLVQADYATAGFAPVVRTKFRTIPGPKGSKPRTIQNRNAMLWLYPGAIGAKTGFTTGAGNCLIAVAERNGRRLVAIILGSQNEAFSEAATLLDFGFEGFEERTYVETGQDLGTIEIRGGAVTGVAGRALQGLVPTAIADRAQRHIVVSSDAVFPPAEGERVGTVKVTLPGLTIGAVPILATEIPVPPDPGDAPWWARAVRTVVGGVGDVIGALFG